MQSLHICQSRTQGRKSFVKSNCKRIVVNIYKSLHSLAICIVNNRQKHVEHNEEDEEDVSDEKQRTQKPIFVLQLSKVKVPQN